MEFIPVCTPYLAGREEEYVLDAVHTGWISSSGKYVQAFEEAFAAYCGTKYAVSVCNGTVALHLALLALGIGPGDEVIIPDFTMIASAFAVCYTGARPVFVDADPATWNIDVTKIADQITPRTRAVMAVHIFGNPCAMDQILALAQEHGLYVVEDAAEAHGAEFKGKKIGSWSDVAAFSFFANKNITTGEGGMVVTNDSHFFDQARYYRNMCFPLDGNRNYFHQDLGFNYRLSNVQAAIGLAQVEKADLYRELRIKNGKLYRELLAEVPGVILQEYQTAALCVHWMNGVLLRPDEFGRSREEVMALLREKGIDSRRFFVGMHAQPCLHKLGCPEQGVFPVSEDLAENGLYLPSGSQLTEEQIGYICETLADLRR